MHRELNISPFISLWNGTKDKAVWISCLPSFVDKSSL